MDFGSVSGEAFRKSQPDIPFSLSVVLPLFLFFFTFSGRWCVALSVTDTQLRDSMIDKRQQPTSPERYSSIRAFFIFSKFRCLQ